jgi:hypothetical protein
MKCSRLASLSACLLPSLLWSHPNYDFDREKDNNYVFSARMLNDVGQRAIATTDHYLQDLGYAKLSHAQDFFRTSLEHGVDTHDFDILEAYRTELILEQIHQNVESLYPGKVLQNPSWIWNNVGGVWGRLRILYCSSKEYIALFGTQLPQAGFSGTYRFMDVWDVMVTGKMHSYSADSRMAFPVSYLPGDASLLRKKESRHYDMDRFTYMIDYGRGVIPASFYSGVIAPFLFSSHDGHSLRRQLGDCGYSMLSNLASSGKAAAGGS